MKELQGQQTLMRIFIGEKKKHRHKSLYQAIVEHDPKDIRAWLMLADCLVRCGDRAGAVVPRRIG